jgi:hypothetical protein
MGMYLFRNQVNGVRFSGEALACSLVLYIHTQGRTLASTPLGSGLHTTAHEKTLETYIRQYARWKEPETGILSKNGYQPQEVNLEDQQARRRC